MTPSMLMVLSAMLTAAAAGLLFTSLVVERSMAKLADADTGRLESRLMRGGRSLWRRQTRQRKRVAELSRLLRQAGHVGTRAQVSVMLSAALAVLGLAAGGALYGYQAEARLGDALGVGLAALLLGGVMAWLWLKLCLARRREQLDQEVELLIQVTRMLWETGMTLEGVLRSLVINLGEMIPASSLELRVALGRIEAGQERGEVLEALADLQLSEGIEAYFNLLAQVSTSGGGAREALTSLSDLLTDRRRTALQERVTKMSGKISVVMMVLLFPALLIVVAGPAVVNLGGLLQTLGGG
jgi:tight adherence protein C